MLMIYELELITVIFTTNSTVCHLADHLPVISFIFLSKVSLLIQLKHALFLNGMLLNSFSYRSLPSF